MRISWFNPHHLIEYNIGMSLYALSAVIVGSWWPNEKCIYKASIRIQKKFYSLTFPHDNTNILVLLVNK